jgi:hypothetical protein
MCLERGNRRVSDAVASAGPVNYVRPVPDRPTLPRSFSRHDLEAAGFVGWRTWDELRRTGLSEVPAAAASYVVYRPSGLGVQFRARTPGGHFKGEDPTVPTGRLTSKWVSAAHVVYIGKADQARLRLTQFARFGAGERVGHWGGRYIWQLVDSAELLVAWHPISWSESAREYEKRLLEAFARLHGGARPFANLTG